MTPENARALEIMCSERKLKARQTNDPAVAEVMVNLGAYCILMRKEPQEGWTARFLEYLGFVADKYDRLADFRGRILLFLEQD